MPPRAIKHQLTCPFELTSGSFMTGRRRILVIPRNHLAELPHEPGNLLATRLLSTSLDTLIDDYAKDGGLGEV